MKNTSLTVVNGKINVISRNYNHIVQIIEHISEESHAAESFAIENGGIFDGDRKTADVIFNNNGVQAKHTFHQFVVKKKVKSVDVDKIREHVYTNVYEALSPLRSLKKKNLRLLVCTYGNQLGLQPLDTVTLCTQAILKSLYQSYEVYKYKEIAIHVNSSEEQQLLEHYLSIGATNTGISFANGTITFRDIRETRLLHNNLQCPGISKPIKLNRILQHESKFEYRDEATVEKYTEELPPISSLENYPSKIKDTTQLFSKIPKETVLSHKIQMLPLRTIPIQILSGSISLHCEEFTRVILAEDSTKALPNRNLDEFKRMHHNCVENIQTEFVEMRIKKERRIKSIIFELHPRVISKKKQIVTERSIYNTVCDNLKRVVTEKSKHVEVLIQNYGVDVLKDQLGEILNFQAILAMLESNFEGNTIQRIAFCVENETRAKQLENFLKTLAFELEIVFEKGAFHLRKTDIIPLFNRCELPEFQCKKELKSQRSFLQKLTGSQSHNTKLTDKRDSMIKTPEPDVEAMDTREKGSRKRPDEGTLPEAKRTKPSSPRRSSRIAARKATIIADFLSETDTGTLQESEYRQIRTIGDGLELLTINILFYKLLRESGHADQFLFIDMGKSGGFPIKLSKEDIETIKSLDGTNKRIIAPLFEEGPAIGHFVILLIDLENYSFTVFDSIPGHSDNPILGSMLRWFNKTFNKIFTVTRRLDIPSQLEEANTCGLHVLANELDIINGRPIPRKRDMRQFRKQLLRMCGYNDVLIDPFAMEETDFPQLHNLSISNGKKDVKIVRKREPKRKRIRKILSEASISIDEREPKGDAAAAVENFYDMTLLKGINLEELILCSGGIWIANVEQNYLGEYEETCLFCKSFDFLHDPCKQVDHTCCADGQVHLPEIRPPFRLIYDLQQSNSGFKKNVLLYNSLFATASIEKQVVKMGLGGVQTLKVKGSIYGNVSTLRPLTTGNPLFGQCFVYDPPEAAKHRIEGSERFCSDKSEISPVNKEVVEDLSVLFDRHNVFHKFYKTMAEIENEYKKEGRNVEKLAMRIIDRYEIDPRVVQQNPGCYCAPKGSDMIAGFCDLSADGGIQLGNYRLFPRRVAMEDLDKFPIGINVYHHFKAKQSVAMPSWVPEAVPMMFPLLFCYGDIDYRNGSIALFPHGTRVEETHMLEKGGLQDIVEDLSNYPPDGFLSEEHEEYIYAEDADLLEVDEQSDDEDILLNEPTLIISDSHMNPKKFVDIGVGELLPVLLSTDEEENKDSIPFEANPNDDGASDLENEDECLQTETDSEYDDEQEEDDQDKMDTDEITVDEMIEEQSEKDIDEEMNQQEKKRFEKKRSLRHVALPTTSPSFIENDSDNEMITEDDEMIGDEEGSKTFEENTKKPVKRIFISRRQYLRHRIQMRPWHRRLKYHSIFSHGKLGQLFCIHQYLQILDSECKFIREKKTRLLSAYKNILTKRIKKMEEKSGVRIGALTRLPKTFKGSARWYQAMYKRAMTIMNQHGRPDLFITFTANRKWKEFTENIGNEPYPDYPYLVCQVFRRKLKHLINDVCGVYNKDTKERAPGIFGRTVAHCYSVEFQQRGLPHAHILLTLHPDDKIDTPQKVDKFIKACFPDIPKEWSEDDPRRIRMEVLNDLIECNMIHKPCENDDSAYCRQGWPPHRKQCSKHFPHPMNEETAFRTDNYAEYRRPKEIDRYVVSFNEKLLMKYRSHINVELCSDIRSIKYIYKYVFKGLDRVLIEMIEQLDLCDASKVSALTLNGNILLPKDMKLSEPAKKRMNKEATDLMRRMNIPTHVYEKGQRIPNVMYDESIIMKECKSTTAIEACWMLCDYPLAEASHAVEELFVHEEGKEPITYEMDVEPEELAQKMESFTSKLRAYFVAMKEYPKFRHLRFPDMPVHFKFSKGKWIPHKIDISRNRIGTIAPVKPLYLELFALRELAMEIRGATGFASYKNVEKNGKVVECDTFAEAARVLGLLDGESEWFDCMGQAAEYQMPTELRRLFCQILIYGAPKHPRSIFDKFLNDMVEREDKGEIRVLSNPVKMWRVLFSIRAYIRHYGRELKDFELDELTVDQEKKVIDSFRLRALEFEGNMAKWKYEDFAHAANMIERILNEEQRQNAKKICEVILPSENISDEEKRRLEKKSKLFFLSGSGGTGKTTLYKYLYHRLRAADKKVEMVAHTGMAANLLIGGTTVHRAFYIPIELDETTTSKINVDAKTKRAQELMDLDVLIWDEATQSDRRVFAAVDQVLRVIRRNDEPFGGVAVLLGGDWKQLLPIVSNEDPAMSKEYTIKKWNIWTQFNQLKLTRNERAKEDPWYVSFLERVGHGMNTTIEDVHNQIEIPIEMIEENENKLIEDMFGYGQVNDWEKVARYSILTVRNMTAMEINDKVLDWLIGPTTTYRGIDTPVAGKSITTLPPEVFHNELHSGQAPYELKLKSDAIVILLRNLNVTRGLCNGTRLRVLECRPDVLKCQTLPFDESNPEIVFIERTHMESRVKTGNMTFSRKQFPVRLAYAMSINKSQGQTLDKVGVVLKNNIFSHGQLYVALSRVRRQENIKLFSSKPPVIKEEEGKRVKHFYVTNMVYTDILS